MRALADFCSRARRAHRSFTCRRGHKEGAALLALVGLLFIAGGVSLLLGIAIPWEPIYLWILLYASVGVTAAGWVLWYLLLREEDAIVLSGSSFIVPMIALIFGWLLLGERIQVKSIAGSALILTGVYLVNSQIRHRDKIRKLKST